MEETVRGDLIKLAQIKTKILKDPNDQQVSVKIFGIKVPIQANELLHRADGSKDFFVLREGKGTFTGLTMFHYSKRYFEDHDDTEIRDHIKQLANSAVYLRTMTVNEKQVYKNTLKRIYAKGLGFWDKHGPAVLMIIVLVLGVGTLIYMSNAQTEQAEIYAEMIRGFGHQVSQALNSTGGQTIQPLG
jgi:hypothetical protein